MLWTQHNITDRAFLEEVTWHGFYKKNDPCLSAFRKDGKVIYKQLSDLIDPNGQIGNTELADIVANSYTVVSSEGFLSSWAGDSRMVPYHHVEHGLDQDTTGNTIPFLMKEPGLAPGVHKVQEIEHLNDNVHDNWWVAYRQNRQLRASMSASQIRTHTDAYSDISPLDCFYLEFSRQDDKTLFTPFSGDWLVTSVNTVIKDSGFTQYIALSRETLL